MEDQLSRLHPEPVEIMDCESGLGDQGKEDGIASLQVVVSGTPSFHSSLKSATSGAGDCTTTEVMSCRWLSTKSTELPPSNVSP